ncbi:hypothetical protein AVEN_62678-1 [Araneus ventricosus]|uniref:Uncharacterized protein n=1 Tax=Araneus ventricosus TaxID=182803 RepID=A0A4Y2FP17_ARAVE|nr:hypothetical protein AVEN_62678-1 [Araneus ventricosus]
MIELFYTPEEERSLSPCLLACVKKVTSPISTSPENLVRLQLNRNLHLQTYTLLPTEEDEFLMSLTTPHNLSLPDGAQSPQGSHDLLYKRGRND